MTIEIKLDTKTNVSELVRILLLKRCVSIAELARRMTVLSGKTISRFNLGAKLRRDTLTFSEMILICEILGYRLDLFELEKK